jgi:hypothetical protein
MSTVAFNSSLKEAQTLLNNIQLFKSIGVKVINKDDVSQEFKTASQKGDYFQLYKCAKTNFDYDILLSDDSLFQFSYKFLPGQLPQIRYAFFQNPQEFKSYEQYLELLRSKNIIEEETNEEIGNAFEEEYQQFLTEQNLNTSSISIRYDFDNDNYKPLIHSVSHLHIGHQNNIRIPCDKILTPLKFSVFILKHVYYYKWKDLVESGNAYLSHCLDNSKHTCLPLLTTHWQAIETKELFLS